MTRQNCTRLISRRALLAWLTLPAACSIQPLPALRRSALPASATLSAIRPPAIGQHWNYRLLNFYNSEPLDSLQEKVTAIAPEIVLSRQSARHGELPSEIQPTWGMVRQDPAWDAVQTYENPLPIWLPFPQVGATQSIQTSYRAGTSSFKLWLSVQNRVSALERVVLACGDFDTVRIDKFIRLIHSDSNRQNFTRTDTLWFAPAIGRWVVRETNGEYWTAGRRPTQYREDHLRWELENWA